jgi:hypothetical protein
LQHCTQSWYYHLKSTWNTPVESTCFSKMKDQQR